MTDNELEFVLVVVSIFVVVITLAIFLSSYFLGKITSMDRDVRNGRYRLDETKDV